LNQFKELKWKISFITIKFNEKEVSEESFKQMWNHLGKEVFLNMKIKGMNLINYNMLQVLSSSLAIIVDKLDDCSTD
jgi:hypothetical protein